MPASEAGGEAVDVGTACATGDGSVGRTRGVRMREAAVAVVATLSRPPSSAACSSDVCAGAAAGAPVDVEDSAEFERDSRLGKGRRGRPVVAVAELSAGELVLESARGGVGGRDVVTSP